MDRSERARNWRRSPGAPPLVFAHRGARAHAPENTMFAFERALADGADGIELDVRTSADGDVVVVHDVDLARVTSRRDSRIVAQTPTSALCAVELDGHGCVPMLAEVIDWVVATNLRVNIELKHDTSDAWLLVRNVASLLRANPGLRERVILSSFHPKILLACAVRLPEFPRALIVHKKQRWAPTAVARAIGVSVGALAIHPEHVLCSPEIVAAWTSAGWIVNVWTVNDPHRATALSTLGVDGLITDDPGGLIALRTRFQKTERGTP